MAAVPAALSDALQDRFRLERELGQGGMATVYLAQDMRHNSRVAVKVLRPELAAVIGAERFVSEITTTANLQHPHILPLFDSGEADGVLFCVMPYVEGETVRDRISREKQLPIAEAMGEREITASSDVYAVGCVLYEMLVGEPPFTGPTAQAIIARVVTEGPRPLTRQRKTIPEHVEAAVEQGLQKLPADRFASAAEFAAALQGQGTATTRRVRSRGPVAPLPHRFSSIAILAAAGLMLAPSRS